MNLALRRILVWTAAGAAGGLMSAVWSALDWRLAATSLVIGAISGASAGCAACVPVSAILQASIVGALGGFTLGVLSYELLGSPRGFAYSVLGQVVSGVIALCVVRFLMGDAGVPELFAPDAHANSTS